MNGERLVAWRRVDEDAGHSVALIEPVADGYRCLATEVLAGPTTLLSCTFRIGLGPDWVTREVRIEAFGAGGDAALELRADDERCWTRDGTEVPELAGCVDIDVAATPLTNTFPIRRLARLAEGASVTLPVAWVDVPSLTVRRVDQTYKRLGPSTWRYSDPEHGGFVLQVDEDGVVIDYEGFAERVG